MEENNELIPREDVIEDMFNDYSATQLQAREYYYTHYATEIERRLMREEDKCYRRIGIIIMSTIAFSTILVAIAHLFG